MATVGGGQTTYLENTLKLRKLHKTKVFMNPQVPGGTTNELQGMLMSFSEKEAASLKNSLTSSVFFP